MRVVFYKHQTSCLRRCACGILILTSDPTELCRISSLFNHTVETLRNWKLTESPLKSGEDNTNSIQDKVLDVTEGTRFKRCEVRKKNQRAISIFCAILLDLYVCFGNLHSTFDCFFLGAVVSVFKHWLLLLQERNTKGSKPWKRPQNYTFKVIIISVQVSMCVRYKY